MSLKWNESKFVFFTLKIEKMRNPFLLLSLLFALLMAACQSEQKLEEYQLNAGYDYFPLVVGKYLTYQIDSTIYDPSASGTNKISTRIFAKEIVTDTFRDNLSQLNYKIERFERRADTLPWAIKDVWVAALTNQQAIRTEENIKFIKIIFPTKKGNSWDGNAFIDPNLSVQIAEESVQMFKNWNYRTLTVDQPATINGKLYPKVMTIEQANNENLIELRQSSEKYARGVGLVSRSMRILDTQKINQGSTAWALKAERGFEIEQILIDNN